LLDAVGLAALGTVADVVPLRDENRVLVKYGLTALGESAAPGIRALIEVSDLEGQPLNPYGVGFRLAPRLNAAGRLGNARRGVELLTTESTERAVALAKELDRENSRRQNLQRKIVQSARRKVQEEFGGQPPQAIVLADDEWHTGVIGIVASKIAEEFHRPTLLIAWEEKVGHGSGRSIERFHLYKALDRCAEMLLSFGGHEQAAGLRLERERYEDFRRTFLEAAQQMLTPDDLVPRLYLDGEIPLPMLSKALVKELEMLAPCGDGNPAPILAVSGVSVAGEVRRMGSEGKHISFYARQGEVSLRAVGFDMADLSEALEDPRRQWSIAFVPKLNRWNDREDVELQIEDMKCYGDRDGKRG
jgi:single-stranded-DNA-specific exonuclease